jgi:Flp pilus assembly protein TadG
MRRFPVLAEHPLRNRPRRGSAATELALLLPIFVTIVLGAVDFGRFAYNYIAVSNAARAAASYAMMNPPNNISSPSTAWQSSVTQRATNEISSQPGYQSSSMTPSPSVSITNTSESPYGTWQFSATVNYQFQTLISWNFNMFGTTLGIPSSLTLSKTVTMRGIRP